MNVHDITDLELMALADGELAEPDAEVVRAAIAADAKLAERYEVFAASRRVMSLAFEELDRTPVPARLLAAARGQQPPQAVPVRRAPPARRRWAMTALALAASLVGAIGLTVVSNRHAGTAPSGVVAALASAAPQLSEAYGKHASGDVVSVQVAGAAYEIVPVASFETSGRWCREFQGNRPDGAESVQGVACLDGGGDWRLDVVTAQADAAAPVDSTGYVPASGSTPMTSRYAGVRRLTPAEEREAIATGWKR